MRYSINGITFNVEELKSVKLDQLKESSILDAHLFFQPVKAMKPILLLKAGDIVEAEFLEKYKTQNIESLCSLPLSAGQSNYQECFSRFTNAENEIERQIVAQEIVELFMNDFYLENENISFLSYSKFCFEYFYSLPTKVATNLSSKSLVLFSRAHLCASLGIMTCLVNKIVDPAFLKDFYNVIFCMDIGLLDEGELSYSVLDACERERVSHGGIDFLKNQKRPQREIDLFINHPRRSVAILEKYKSYFNSPEIIDFIKYHHEKADGSGFPDKIPYDSITNIETFLNFSDFIIPFRSIDYFIGDGRSIIKDAFDSLEKEKSREIEKKVFEKYNKVIIWKQGDAA